MICHTFPPGSAVGGFRATRFAKHLRTFGWEPVVLAMAPHSYLSGKVDPELTNQLPTDLIVERVPAWRPLRRVKRSIKSMLQRLGRSAGESDYRRTQTAPSKQHRPSLI